MHTVLSSLIWASGRVVRTSPYILKVWVLQLWIYRSSSRWRYTLPVCAGHEQKLSIRQPIISNYTTCFLWLCAMHIRPWYMTTTPPGLWHQLLAAEASTMTIYSLWRPRRDHLLTLIVVDAAAVAVCYVTIYSLLVQLKVIHCFDAYLPICIAIFPIQPICFRALKT